MVWAIVSTNLFAKAFGGTNDDRAYSIVQTSDGGYAVAGWTYSFGAGYHDFLVLKLSSDGSLEWAKTFGRAESDFAYSIIQTSDGGYAVAGGTERATRGIDFLVFKLSSDGSLEWARAFGGGMYWMTDDYAYSIVQTSDGGYAVAGYTLSFGAGSKDFLVLKLSPDGSLEWAKTFGGAAADEAYSIVQTSDGGYAVAGWTRSFGAGYGDSNFLVLKLSSTGSLEWARTFEEGIYLGTDDYARSIIQTSDGGYAVAGWARSFGAGGEDFLVLKLSPKGSLEWAKIFGGDTTDYAYSIIQTSDGGYAVAGETWSFGAGWSDFLVLTLNSDGSYEGCVPDAAPTEQSVSPSINSPSLLTSNPNLSVDSSSLLVSDISPYIADICPPSTSSSPRLTYSPLPGGLLFSSEEPTQVKIYSVSGRLVKSLLVEGKVRVSLKPGVYLLRWPGGGGAAAVR